MWRLVGEAAQVGVEAHSVFGVQQAAQGTTEIASQIGAVSTAAGETGAAATQVLGTASGLSHEADTLRLQVDSFVHAIREA